MPQAVPAIIVAAGQAIAGVAISKIIVAFVVNVALTYLSEALSERPRDPGRPPVNVTINDTVEHRHLVTGTRRVGGSFVFVRTSGDANKFLWFVIAYADHQCNALQDAWFDEFHVPAADINAGTGAVSTGWANNKVWIWSHLGTQAQTVDAQLTAEFTTGADYIKWEATDRLRGVCYRVIKMERDDTAFPTGAPNHVSALVEGALTYDWRLDSTNGGSGSHRMDNPSTWSFSNNWPRNVLWLLTGGSVVNDQATRLVKYGIREEYSRIDWPFWVAAANIADQSLSGANAPPDGAQARYTLDMEVTTAQTRREILDLAIRAGAGELVYVHGKWRLYAGAYDTPVHTFTQDDLRGDMEVEDTTDEEERVNRVAAVYVDHDRQWKEHTTPYRFNAAYDTQDLGRELPKEIELLAVTDQHRAQRICELELRKARQMRRTVFRFGRKGMKVAPHETFYFSHTRLGWVNREWRCVKRRRERTQDGGIITVITARSEDASIYTDLVTADYLSGTSVTNAIQSEAPEPPTSLEPTPHPLAIEFNWSLGAFWTLHGITELWEASTDSFGSASKIWEGRGTRIVVSRFNVQTRYYWVRMRTIAGQTSATFPATNGVQSRPLDAVEETFFDGFEHQDVLRFWDLVDGTPTITYPADGQHGGRVLQAAGKAQLQWKKNIPYNGDELLLVTARARMVTAPSDSSRDNFYAGVVGYAADGATKIQTNGASSGGVEHYVAANNFDFGGVALGQWVTFRGYLTGHSASPSPAPAPDISNPMEMYGSGGTVVRFIRPTFVLNVEGGNGVMQVDHIRIDRVRTTEDIGPIAVTDSFVLDEPADGSQAYGAVVQPQVEASGIGGLASYTSPATRSTEVKVSWSVQARISNTTSGVAVGTSYVRAAVTIDGSLAWESIMTIEAYSGSDEWATFSGTRDFSVPAGEEIEVFLNSARNFTTGGTSPAQTHFWQNAMINLKAAKA